MSPKGPAVAAGIEIPGPWRHVYVAANGARFHLATAGPDHGPAVLLLHGFPQFWWSWRHQIPALAEAGHRVIAMDLRGYGGSDKPPLGYDPMTLAADVAGVIAAAGGGPAAVVGHGWGGYLAWSTATMHPASVRSVIAVSAPHPRAMLSSFWRGGPMIPHLLAMQLPMLPERRIRRPEYVQRHLATWSGGSFPSADEVAVYARALANWPSPHCALEYHRWLLRSRIRDDGRRFNTAMRHRLTQPSYAIFGGSDPTIAPATRTASARYVAGEHRVEVVEGAGHFVPEERPEEFTRLLLEALTDRV